MQAVAHHVGLIKADTSYTAELYKVIDGSRKELSNLVWAATVTEEGVYKHLRDSTNTLADYS